MAYKNIEDLRAYHRKWYKKNKKHRYAQIQKSKIKRKKIAQNKILKHFLDNPCCDCGEENILVLEFDHLFNKKENISTLLSNSVVWKRIKREIDKCDVVCANCHRIRTAKRNKDYRWVSLINK